MGAGWEVGKASVAEAQRIATLARTQGGPYVEALWALVEYAQDENVRRLAYAQATRSNGD
jgi:hypothetical protein